MKYEGLNHNELIKIENEQNWRFTQLLIALIIGILAFSIETLSGEVKYTDIEFLYISWILLLIAFLSGLARLFSFQKRLSILTRQNNVGEQSTMKKKATRGDYVLINRIASYLLIICFVLGMASYAIFKVKNII